MGTLAASHPEAHVAEDIVLTRFAPGVQRAMLVERGALLERLDLSRTCRLILLVAPAGYGKTTLLGQWRRRLLSMNVRVGWLTLDGEDGGAGELVACICHSLSIAGLKCGSDAGGLAGSDGANARDNLKRILNLLALDGTSTVLILDEADHLDEEMIATVIAPLLRWAPPNLTIAIGARATPEIPLSSLRVQGLIGALRAEELRFTAAEIGALFPAGLSRQDIAAISHHTGGWPVALQLLRNCWSRDNRNVRESYDGLREEIASYVAEQLFSSIPEELHAFLVRISILDTLCPRSIEAVTGSLDVWRRIEASETLKPFFVNEDRGAGLYRLRPVLREALRASFLQLQQRERHDLHRAAAHWHARNHYLIPAVQHALEADDPELAGRSIEDAGGIQIWIRHGFKCLKAIDALLTPELLTRFPRLQLLRALVLAKEGATVEASRLYEAARAATANFMVDGDAKEPAALQLDSMVVHSTLLFNQCLAATDDHLESYGRAMRRIAGDDHVFLAHTKTTLGLTCHQRGLFEGAASAFREAIDYGRRADLPHAEFFDQLHIGAIDFAQGRREAAGGAYVRAAAIARKHFPDDETKGILLSVLRAELAYECNDLGLAKQRLKDIENRLSRTEAWFDIHASAYGLAVYLALECEGPGVALATLDRVTRRVADRQLVGLEPFLVATRISCLTLAGSLAEAVAVREEAGFDLHSMSEKSDGFWREDEAILIALVRLEIALHRSDRVCGILPAMVKRLETRNHIRSAIRLGLLLAMAFKEVGRDEESFASLEATLKHSAASGYSRCFFEEGSAVWGLIQQYSGRASDVGDAAARKYADVLLALEPVSDEQRKHVPLSPREMQVLHELNRGGSDKMIARTLGLSENTVKFHLKNIYQKLRAISRTEAISIAHSLEIV